MKRNLILSVTALLGLVSVETFAALVSGYGNVGIGYATGSGNIAGESYSSVPPVESYQTDNGLPIYDPWQPITAETSVTNASGSASSSAVAPFFAAYDAHVQAEAQANSSDLSHAWASIKATSVGVVPGSTGKVSFDFSYSYSLDMPVGSEGFVRFYIGLWEGLPEQGNLLLASQNGWSVANIGTESNPLNVLSKTFYSGSTVGDEDTEWLFSSVANAEYSYYAMIDTQTRIVPEPATVLLLLMGIGAIRKTHSR